MSLQEVFRALADPTRRQILKHLQDGDLTAGEISTHFVMSKPSLSHHLGVLKQAGLVADTRRGQNIVYSLNTTVFQEVLAWIIGVSGKGEPS